MSKTFPKEIRERAVQLSRNGMPVKAIAVELKVSERVIKRWRSSAGIGRENPYKAPATKEQLERGLALLKEGCSYEEAARSIGYTSYVLRTRFPGMGWTSSQSGKFALLLNRTASEVFIRTGKEVWPDTKNMYKMRLLPVGRMRGQSR